MRRQFYILLSQKTSSGYTTYGQFWLGFDRQLATEIFSKLKQSEKDPDELMLHLDFMECVDEIPVKIKTISCTLEDYGYNCKLITKELFRTINLDGQQAFSFKA
jgi:hypothetical protein